MADLTHLYDQYRDLPEESQKQAGKAIAGDMSTAHNDFLALLLSLLEKKDIDPSNPKTFLNQSVYDALPEAQRDGIDLALINLATMLQGIVEFRLSTKTPDSSPQLQTMIDALWQAKSGIEEKAGDILKF